MKASVIKREFHGRRIHAWSNNDIADYQWDYIRQHPTWAGYVSDVKGRNVLIGSDYVWAPDINKIELAEDQSLKPTIL